MTHAYGIEAAEGRSGRLDRVLQELVGQVPEIEAASVVSFDGLAMASALPPGMDEDRVAAMSAALLSLGERAAEGLGRGALSQVYVEGEDGTVFLISADDEAVLVAVAAKGAKVGLMLFEVRLAAAAVADVLRVDVPVGAVVQPVVERVVEPVARTLAEPVARPQVEPVAGPLIESLLQAVPEQAYRPSIEAFEPRAAPLQPDPAANPSSASWYAAETFVPNGAASAADTSNWG